MTNKNIISNIITKMQILPLSIRKQAMSSFFGFAVKFFGTASIRVDKMSATQTVMTLKNRTKVQNHIGTIHAAAMSLLAESATGLLVAYTLPDDKLPLIKSMNFNYIKRAAPGELVAVAELTPSQLDSIQNEDKGEVTVKVIITDIKGVEPVICTMLWAWVPKQRN